MDLFNKSMGGICKYLIVNLPILETAYSIFIVYQVFRVNLVLFKNDENSWILTGIHTAVIEILLQAVFGRRTEIGRLTACKLSYQHSSQKHGLAGRLYQTIAVVI